MHPQTAVELEIIVRRPDTARKAHPVVFVHGAWHGAWCWDEYFLDYFVQRGYTVYAPSLRHHGGSTGPHTLRRSRIDDYVADLAAVTSTLSEPPILVGHSMGGLIVQKYLETAPAAAGVLLAAVPPRGALQATLRTIRRIPWKFIKANLQLRLYPLVETPQLTREAFFSPRISGDTLLKYFRLIQDESYCAFLDMVIFRLPKPRRVSTRMLVLGGEDDTIFRPNEIHATAAAYGTQARLFPGMAHDMMLEPDWQAVADTILDWLEAQGL